MEQQSNTTARLKAIARKILEDRATKEEKSFFLGSLDHSDERLLRDVLFPEEEWLRQPGEPVPAVVREKMLKVIFSAGKAGEPAERPKGLLRYILAPRLKWVAAASVLILFFSYLYLQQRSSRAAMPLTYLERVTLPGQHMLIILPDSSRVYLNAGSRLKYPEKYAETSREVYLEGEAFFKVTKNKHLPFIVHTNRLSTRVLGTSFDVRNYATDADMSVSVKTGRVSVSYITDGAVPGGQGTSSAILLPGQQVSIDRQHSGLMHKDTVDGEDVGSWTDNRLIFRKTPLSRILHTLERTYRVRFHVSDPLLLNCVYTMKFDNLPLEEVLDNLKTIGLHIQRQKQDREFMLKGSCHSAATEMIHGESSNISEKM